MLNLPAAAPDDQLRYFFTNMLQEMYWCEQQMVNVLSTMSEFALDGALQRTFEKHRIQSEQHAGRLEDVFRLWNSPQEIEQCIGMQGLYNEGWELIDATPEKSFTRDITLLMAAQKTKYYEIACYESMIHLAHIFSRADIAGVLEQAWKEKKQSGAALTSFATGLS